MGQKIYRDYDQDALDRQLNLRARWPEHPEYFARWARDSATARTRLAGDLDLVYGPTPGQRLDLFPADGPQAGPRAGPQAGPAAGEDPDGSGAPLLAFIHGGYWQALDKSDHSALAPPFVAAGIAFASLNHDLAPGVGLAEIVRQIRAALVWLFENAARLGVDPDRLYVAGHSAGGHLAAMALATDWAREARGPGDLGPGDLVPGDLVKGACLVSGLYELEPIRLSYHQEVLGLGDEAVETLSPLRLRPRGARRLVCAVGAEETEVFIGQQAELAAAWRAAGLAPRVVDLPGRNHFSAIDALGEPDHPLHAAVREMILGGR